MAARGQNISLFGCRQQMDFDYFSIDAILAENQKIQCTFKHEIKNMGHLAGGSDRDVREF